MKKNNPKFLELLTAKNLLNREDEQSLLAEFKGDASLLLEHLIKTRPGDAGVVADCWGESIGTARVELEKVLFQKQVVEKLPIDLAVKHKMIPLYKFGRATTVAMADPENSETVRQTEKALGGAVSPVFALPGEIEDAIEVQYQSAESLNVFISKVVQDPVFSGKGGISTAKLKKLAQDKSVIDLTRGLMLLALRERASDIHIEPEEDRIRVRMRIDGVLQEKLSVDIALLPAIVSSLKVQAELDTTERRRPQDGRIRLNLSNKSVDFRLSTVPFVYGEKVVMRVLGQLLSRDIPDISELRLSETNYRQVLAITNTPNGVFFVTGPTGSGKTTTLFSVLKNLNTPDVNIVTAEDPVEYRLPGINQLQVNADIGLDFATCLRSFLRQDPNVILIGEIRDVETAKTAAQAALTGHLVLATMHTNNALQAVTRLVEIGVEPFLVAPSIIGIMSQRLVRGICEHCKEEYEPSDELLARYFTWKAKPKVTFYRGKGCPECGNSGYMGRLAIQELVIMSDNIRALVSQNVSILDIEKEARRGGFKDMIYDGLKKVIRGLTTIEEVERVTITDEAPV